MKRKLFLVSISLNVLLFIALFLGGFTPLPVYSDLGDPTLIKVYLLPVDLVNGADVIRGSEYIHNAVVECTEAPNIRKLIMIPTTLENTALSLLALEVREPTEEEVNTYIGRLEVEAPVRDLASEIDEIKVRLDAVELKVVK